MQSERTPAYSGWCKPFVERNFARLQNHLTEWLKGYIGHKIDEYADSFMNNAYLKRIEKTPTQAYNERASEKEKMSKARALRRLKFKRI